LNHRGHRGCAHREDKRAWFPRSAW